MKEKGVKMQEKNVREIKLQEEVRELQERAKIRSSEGPEGKGKRGQILGEKRE